MAEPIRISALGRDAHVGNFYNYFTDEIFSSGIEIPKEYKSISETANAKVFTFYRQTDKYKRYMLGINSHLFNSTEKKNVDLNKLWFANYFNESPKCDGNDAKVTVFIQVIRRTETLDSRFFFPKMHEYRLQSSGRATHLMEKVVYGAEMICSIRKRIDWKSETTESVEGSLYLAVKNYFDQIVDQNLAMTPLPIELDDVTCSTLSSLDAGNELNTTFQEFIQNLRNVTHSLEDDRPEKWKPIEIVLRDIPIQIETQIWSENRSDIKLEKEQHQVTWNWIEKESRNLSNHSSLDRFPPLEKVMCQFKDVMQPFWMAIQKSYENHGTPEEVLKVVKCISDILTDMTDWLAQRRKEIEGISLLLNGTQLVALDLEDIKTRMRKDVEQKYVKVFVLKVFFNQNIVVDKILKVIGEQTSAFELPILHITSLMKDGMAEVRKKLHEFADEANLMRGGTLRATCYHIALVPYSSPLIDGEILDWDFSDRVSQQSLVKLYDPISPSYSHGNVEQNQQKSSSLYPELSSLTISDNFSTKQQQEKNFASFDESHHYGVSEAEENQIMDVEQPFVLSFDSDGMEDIVEMINSDDSSNRVVEFMAENTKTNLTTEQVDSNEIPNIHERRDFVTNRTGNDVTEQGFLNSTQMMTKDTQDSLPTSVADFIQKSAITGRNQEDDIILNKSSCDQESVKTTRSKSSCRQVETTRCYETGSEASETTCRNDRNQEREYQRDGDSYHPHPMHEEPLLNQTVGELFMTNGHYSQLIKSGQPNIFLLNATELSISEDFRCFDIGQPQDSIPSHGMQNHKVIILMGATGCGKSTLINGMVNYILGVQWNDPFRFKCVRDDETTAKNQAHSQTSSVTAYTLRHHKGMAVPYSITIIDTPGYGDTRGVKRDKEITRKIHQFLTQQETRVNEIHAACFVAASGNSRLTATQGYIIDSVLSIFGKDVKENIRLLVTFADNAHPPVVEACLAANFPVTSTSAGITFSKFNSSVLYANNRQQGADDFCFDELFWDMGQENFHKFFTMLQGMNGRNLSSTRNVIQSRKLLEQSLEKIEQELEVCFVKIENMEMFHRKMKEYGHKMESNKHHTFQKTEMRLTEVSCNEGFFANNCHRCRNTCERPIKQKKKEKLQEVKRKCDKELCVCPASEHEFQPFEWRLTPVKITTTLKDMKAEYESNYDDKKTVEQLLADCSYELNVAKCKVFSLLDQVGNNVRLLESTALRSNALTPSDYLSLIKSRVAEEQAPGYLTRLETLTELQNCLAADASASASNIKTRSFSYKKNQSCKTGGGDFGSDKNLPKTNQYFQHSDSTSYPMTSKKPAGAASNYNSSLSNSRTANSPSSSIQSNNQIAETIRMNADHESPINKQSHNSLDSKDYYSSDDDKEKKSKKVSLFSSIAASAASMKDAFFKK